MVSPGHSPGIGNRVGYGEPQGRNVLKHYLFIDYATQGYMLLVAVLVLLFHGGAIPHWILLIGAHVVAITLLHWLIQASARAPQHAALSFLRHFYPILLYAGLYREVGELNQMFVTGALDHHMIRFDQWLFGWQPSIALMDRFPSVWVSELFYISYFSYYVMIVGVGLALFLRDRRQFFHFVSVVSLVFYCCYLAYIFYPVIGPRVFYTAEHHYILPADLQALYPAVTFPASVQTGLFYRIMDMVYATFEPSGAAFPSSHVAVAIVTATFSWRYLPRIRILHWVAVVMLSVSTVYCRYHYVADVLAGALTAVVLIPIAERLYRRYGESPATAPT
jgi:membrane-associated phospholipid phosphatase